MIKTFEIKKTDITIDYRFEASYYYFSKIIKEKSITQGVTYYKLKSICSSISDGEHSAIPRQKEAGVRYLYGRNIKDGIVNFDPNTDSSYITEKDYQYYRRIHLKENDILLTIVGTIGKTALYKQDYIGKAGIPRHIARIRLLEDCDVSPEYIVAFFLSKLGKWQLNNITTGNIQPLLSIGNIEKLDIPIIDNKTHDDITLKEKKFVENETKALSLLSQAQELFYSNIGIDFKKTEKTNTFSISKSELASAGLWNTTYFNPLYSKTLKEIQNKWETLPLNLIADISKGDEVGSGNYYSYLDKKNSDVPFVRTSDIVNFEVDQYPDFYVPSDIYSSLSQDIKPNDILFTNDGKIGQVALVTNIDKFILQSHIRKIRLNNNAISLGITPEYLFLVLSIKEIGIYQSKKWTVIQSTIPTMANYLGNMEIPILDRETISGITNLVRQAFLLKDEKKRLMAEIRETMDSYFLV